MSAPSSTTGTGTPPGACGNSATAGQSSVQPRGCFDALVSSLPACGIIENRIEDVAERPGSRDLVIQVVETEATWVAIPVCKTGERG